MSVSHKDSLIKQINKLEEREAVKPNKSRQKKISQLKKTLATVVDKPGFGQIQELLAEQTKKYTFERDCQLVELSKKFGIKVNFKDFKKRRLAQLDTFISRQKHKYSKEVEANIVKLHTMMGGMKPPSATTKAKKLCQCGGILKARKRKASKGFKENQRVYFAKTYKCLTCGRLFNFEEDKLYVGDAATNMGWVNYLKVASSRRDAYHQYLMSSQWESKRQELFKLRGKKCERCQDTKDIQVHHKTYDRLGQEKLTDLEVLCSACHQKEHGVLTKAA